MRRNISLCMALIVLSGCGRKAPPPPGEGGPALQPLALAPQPVNAGQASSSEAVYEGRTAPQWAGQLANPTATARARACMALRELRDGGFQHLFDGMRSRSAETRLVCLQALYQPVL